MNEGEGCIHRSRRGPNVSIYSCPSSHSLPSTPIHSHPLPSPPIPSSLILSSHSIDFDICLYTLTKDQTCDDEIILLASTVNEGIEGERRGGEGRRREGRRGEEKREEGIPIIDVFKVPNLNCNRQATQVNRVRRGFDQQKSMKATQSTEVNVSQHKSKPDGPTEAVSGNPSSLFFIFSSLRRLSAFPHPYLSSAPLSLLPHHHLSIPPISSTSPPFPHLYTTVSQGDQKLKERRDQNAVKGQSTKVNVGQRESTRVNESQRGSTWVKVNQRESTRVNESQRVYGRRKRVNKSQRMKETIVVERKHEL